MLWRGTVRHATGAELNAMNTAPTRRRRQVWGQSGVLSHSAAGDSLPTRVPPCDVAFQVLQVPTRIPRVAVFHMARYQLSHAARYRTR